MDSFTGQTRRMILLIVKGTDLQISQQACLPFEKANMLNTSTRRVMQARSTISDTAVCRLPPVENMMDMLLLNVTWIILKK